MRQNRSLAGVDRFLDFLDVVSNRRQVYFLRRPFLRDPGDDFIVELAVASRAEFIVTHNVRDFSGAAWVWELARVWFPFARLILDFSHAAEHVGLLTEILFGKDTPQARKHREAWVTLPKDQENGVDQLITKAQAATPRRGKNLSASSQSGKLCGLGQHRSRETFQKN